MFSVITGNLAEQIDTLKKVLDTHDSLRALIFPPVDVGGEGVIQAAAGNEHGPEIVADNLFRKQIHNSAPTKSSWQVYDHCAVFTRLYAVYEQFIENLVSEYLRILPDLYRKYVDLPLSITRQHRLGVGQILLKLGKDGPYKDFEETEIIKGFSSGLRGDPDYTLLRHAFLVDPQNYRSEALVKLFSYIGFENCWPWVENHPLIVAFMREHRDSNETPKTLLHDFIEYRNKASHTVVEEIAATEEIKSIADFVVILSETLAQLVMKQVIERQKTLGELSVVGSILHRFSDNVVGVGMSVGEIAGGDELCVVQKYACFRVTVLNIQVGNTPHQNLRVTEGQEIGLKLSARVNEGAELLRPRVRPARVVEEQIPEPTPEPMPEELPSGLSPEADSIAASDQTDLPTTGE